MTEKALMESVLKRDRIVVSVALVVVIAAGWAYVLTGAGMGMSAAEMSSLSLALGGGAGVADTMMGDAMEAMVTPAVWSPGYAILIASMWWVMMIAMMLPSAAPMILLHARVVRRGAPDGDAGTSVLFETAAFTFGYLGAWGGFAIAAAALQYGFEAAGILSPVMLNSTNALFAGAILIFAGLYQLTPVKQACLRHCRSPISFLSRHWRPGAGGAFAMGIHHGAYCLGCCWGLMVILFFGGVMNLYWIVGLAVIVLVEKVLPVGPRLGQAIGGLLLVWGAGFVAVFAATLVGAT